MSTCTGREKLENITFTLLRIAVGIIMAVHGYGKLMAIPETVQAFTALGIPLPGIAVYLAIAGELGGGLGLIVGLFTPIAALGVASTMAVAVFQVHFSNGLLMKNNGFEYPLTLLCVSLYFIAKGGGCMSLDALFFRCGRSKSC